MAEPELVKRENYFGTEIADQTVSPYATRTDENILLKRHIASIAKNYVVPGKSLFFDSGSTILALAEVLPDKPFTITTFGCETVLTLAQRCHGNIFSTGGQLSIDTMSCIGEIAEKSLDEINIDTAFMSASGFSLKHGFMTSNQREQAIKKKVIAKASRIVMLIDSTKFSRIFPFSFTGLKDIHMIITDKPLPEEIAEEAREHQVELVFPAIE